MTQACAEINIFGRESDLCHRLFDFWNFFSPFLSLHFSSFCHSDWPSTGLACSWKTSEKVSLERANYRMEQPSVVAQNLLWVFHSTFWAFLCISKAPFGRSLWSGHHWKDVSLLQKLSVDDANFGLKWWRQKMKKGQGLSRAVTGGIGVNGLKSWHWLKYCVGRFGNWCCLPQQKIKMHMSYSILMVHDVC